MQSHTHSCLWCSCHLSRRTRVGCQYCWSPLNDTNHPFPVVSLCPLKISIQDFSGQDPPLLKHSYDVKTSRKCTEETVQTMLWVCKWCAWWQATWRTRKIKTPAWYLYCSSDAVWVPDLIICELSAIPALLPTSGPILTDPREGCKLMFIKIQLMGSVMAS